MKKYRIAAIAVLICIMSIIKCETVNAMSETAYGYAASSLTRLRLEFLEAYRQKKEAVKYRDIGEADWPLVDSVQLIYQKHYQDNPNSLPVPYCTYNAKGNFYADVVYKKYSRIVLVYDGISENGQCYLFVAEEEHYDVDGTKLDNTSLLEFYAVNLEEGRVYEAHKNTWGGVESEEYREATREQ